METRTPLTPFPVAAPTPAQKVRYIAPDLARGLALLGIALANQVVAFLLSRYVLAPLLAPLARGLTAKKSILLALAVYTGVSIWGFFMATAVEFWLLAMMVGLVQGGSQALSRSMFGNMVPKARTAEFFGFYDMSSKFAGLLGPLLFAVVGQIFGSSRLSIVSLIVFFIVGGLILSRVDEEEGVRVAREADAQVLSS